MIAYTLSKPLTASVVGSSIVLALSFFPPDFYTQIMAEKNLMFFDTTLFSFVLLNLVLFFLGSNLIRSQRRERLQFYANFSEALYKKNNATFLIGICLIIFFTAIIDLISNNQSLFLYILNGLVPEIKGVIEIPFFYQWGLYFMISVYLSIYGYFGGRFSPIILRLLFSTILILALLIFARNIIFPFLISAYCLFLRNNSKEIKFSSIVLLLSLVMALFGILQVLRGGEAWEGIIGYLPASVNRLSAVLSGDILSENPSLYYLMAPFKNNTSFNEIIFNEHNSISQSGLNGTYNWVTVFGYIFFALGWLSPVYFFILGIVTKFFWRSFCNRYALGLILYPWIYSSIILWFSFNILSYSQTLFLIINGIFIHLVLKTKISL